MPLDKILIIVAWIITAIALILLVPKNRIREAWVIFLFKQFLTWILGIAMVELRLIEYPVRFFAYANKTSFSFEYYIYPAICVIFNLHYPENRNKIIQFLHFVAYCTGISIFEVLCEHYTNIIKYTGWTWYYTWISLFITFFISRTFYIWFFRAYKEA